MRSTWIILAALAILFSAMVLVPGDAEADPGKSDKVSNSGNPGGGAPGAIIIDMNSETIIWFYWDFGTGEKAPPNIAIKLPDGSIVFAGGLAHYDP